MKKHFLSVLVFFLLSSVSSAQTPEDYIVRTFVDSNGDKIDEIIVPGQPPEHHREPAVELPDPSPSDGVNILSSVPAFDWCYGCSATAAAMIAGYYDNHGYSNMYTGPTNGGVVPMNNSAWGYGECSLSATHMGYDGLSARGHVDDYWVSSGSSGDPYYGNWTQHSYEDCTADYMGTNQYYNWSNVDGGTTFYFHGDGTPLYDYTGCEPDKRDGCHGFRLFIESRGYSIASLGNYNQYILGYSGNTNGFTFDQFKDEIDTGCPVIIQIAGHSMLGFGYDDNDSKVYIHDTWDHSNHIMNWGGSYSGMVHYGVSVFNLAGTAIEGETELEIGGAPLLVLNSISPNPFSDALSVTYSIPAETMVHLSIFDLSGRLIEELIDERLPAGSHTAVWTPDHSTPGGCYLVVLNADRHCETGRCLKLN